jgi:predicted DNA-binding protein
VWYNIFGGENMRFVVEMDDEQYQRLEKTLKKSGMTITEAIADFFDDLDDVQLAKERLSEVASGAEQIIPWEQVRVAL